MAVIQSKIEPTSAAFEKNRSDMLERIAALREIEAKVRASEEAKRDKFEKRGQLLPRERLQKLLDPGAPFLELSTLCGYKQHDDKNGELAGGNNIVGIGYVSGVRCLVTVNNSAIKGGTSTPFGVQKSLRAQYITLAQKLPTVSLIESGGANLNYQSEMFVPGGEIFANLARISAAGLPQICVVHGSSTAGGAYMPGLSDYTIMVRGNAKVFLAGPPLLKAATGEVAGDEELGGAEMHSYTAGTSEYLVNDDATAVAKAREVMAHMNWQSTANDAPLFAEPKYPTSELAGVVPTDYRKPYDCRELFARIIDGSDFTEFKAEYDTHTICGTAKIHGHTVGLIGNNGPITTKGATKAAQFIQLCDTHQRPLVFMQNTTGFMVGTDSEQNGIVKHGSKMIQAVANSTVPKLTIIAGGSFGAGNYGMCGRGFNPDFIFAWPNSRSAVMGGEQAAGVLEIVATEKMQKLGQEVPTEFIADMKTKLIDQFDRDSDPFVMSGRLCDDGLIDPRDTRRVLGYCLSICLEARARQPKPTTYGAARL